MPRDERINETPGESSAESMQDQLWNMIETCKQNDHAHRNGHARPSTNGCAPDGDKALVNALSVILNEDHNSAAADGLAARAQLLAEISRSIPATPQASKRRSWFVPDKRQFLLAAALIIITVAAIGSLIFSFKSGECPPGETTTPAVKKPIKTRTPVPRPRKAALLGGIDRLLPAPSRSSAPPASGKCV